MGNYWPTSHYSNDRKAISSRSGWDTLVVWVNKLKYKSSGINKITLNKI